MRDDDSREGPLPASAFDHPAVFARPNALAAAPVVSTSGTSGASSWGMSSIVVALDALRLARAAICGLFGVARSCGRSH